MPTRKRQPAEVPPVETVPAEAPPLTPAPPPVVAPPPAPAKPSKADREAALVCIAKAQGSLQIGDVIAAGAHARAAITLLGCAK